MVAFWDDVDVALTPTLAKLPVPAASVPFGNVDGLPVGIQLIGPPAGEAVLLRLAAQLEGAHPWRLPELAGDGLGAG